MINDEAAIAQVSALGTGWVKVLLPLPLAGPYDYRVPEGLELHPGQFVHVPLGNRRALGVVWDKTLEEQAETESAVAPDKLKDVIGLASALEIPEENRRLVDWVSAYTTSPQGAVLRMAMSVPAALQPPKPRIAFTLRDSTSPPPVELRLTGARARVLELLSEGPPRTVPEISQETGVSAGVVKGLVTAGALVPVELPAGPPIKPPNPDYDTPQLSPAQAAAAQTLRAANAGFSVTLLDGVTGAGKTEVYFEAVAETLRSGRQALVLLPEIALSAQWLRRFEARFGVRPTEWHSDLPPPRRRMAWRAVAEGTAKVVVGARSALFLPFPHLGLIVVDEEHEPAFKQEDGVAYHARDMAIVRAQIGVIPVVLVSATPSLESVVNVEQGRFRHLCLPERHAGASLPEIKLIDLRRDAPDRQSWLSPTLKKALVQNLTDGEQSLLFLNRRGYAPLTLCRRCGHRFQCPNCTAWLVEHRFQGKLQCHHCGLSMPKPAECPECEAEDTLVACGPGVERLAEEVKALLPDARIALVTSDTIHRPSEAAEFVRQMTENEVDILIGTQIVAKGHHFPKLTLVGVIDADLGLAGGDLRAAERTYQMLHQVAGRAGRADHQGQVLLQTWRPEHPVMQALATGGRDEFMETEAEMRQSGGWPPFGRLAALIVSGPDKDAVEAVSRQLAASAPVLDGVRVLGPAPAPLAVLRGRHRQRLLLKATRKSNVPVLLRQWLAPIRTPASVRIRIDVDPYSFL